MKIKKLKKIPVIVLAITIFILSSFKQRLPTGGEGPPNYFYKIFLMLLHMGEFGLFAMFLMLGFYPQFKLYFLIGISLLYGVLDEIHQFFIPTRYFDVVDILCDSIGTILGVLFCLIIYKAYKRKKRYYELTCS